MWKSHYPQFSIPSSSIKSTRRMQNPNFQVAMTLTTLKFRNFASCSIVNNYWLVTEYMAKMNNYIDRKSSLLNNSCEFPGSQHGFIIWSSSDAHHLSCFENSADSRCARKMKSHHTCEAFVCVLSVPVARLKKLLQINRTAQVHCGHHISKENFNTVCQNYLF